ncbi:MAG: hypothetical protein GXC78_10380 [Chitinophagaceae bacterium]|nr:hypothetical protein [Chitinophagaceae bacterium]
MKHAIPVIPPASGVLEMHEIRQVLEGIEEKMEAEISAKQRTIDRQEEELRRLQALLEEKTRVIADVEEKLLESMRKSEGNRQLINKLLGDIDRLNQDVEWYKRTYEKRKVLGIVKDRLGNLRFGNKNK